MHVICVGIMPDIVEVRLRLYNMTLGSFRHGKEGKERKQNKTTRCNFLPCVGTDTKAGDSDVLVVTRR